MTIQLGSADQAMFRCRHQLVEAIIDWRVNGSSYREFSDITSNSISRNGTTMYTLTIPARLKYNRAEIVCVAAFIDGSPTQQTPAAILTLIAG